MKNNKKVFIRTLGCQMNVRDSEVICGLLKNAGYKITDEPNNADIVLFNTCSVRQHAEDKVWSAVGRIVKMSPLDFAAKTRKIKTGGTPRPTKKIVGLVGCMAQNYKEKIFERAPQVDFVIGPSDIAKIPEIIKKCASAPVRQRTSKNLFESKIWETDGSIRPDGIYRTGYHQDKGHTYVVISEGCSNFCSYCVVPYVRGLLRNRHYKDILREVEEAVDKGITNITLLGQNVNAYVDFLELLKLVNDIKGLKEFGFITSHPKDTSQDIFKAMQELPKVKKSLHLPVQSGSDRILSLMERGYTQADYLSLARKYRSIVADGRLTTDIIVGFPMETDEDFEATHQLMKEVDFDAAYIFKYSVRPHTKAAEIVDDVPKDIKEKRHRILLDFITQKT